MTDLTRLMFDDGASRPPVRTPGVDDFLSIAFRWYDGRQYVAERITDFDIPRPMGCWCYLPSANIYWNISSFFEAPLPWLERYVGGRQPLDTCRDLIGDFHGPWEFVPGEWNRRDRELIAEPETFAFIRLTEIPAMSIHTTTITGIVSI